MFMRKHFRQSFTVLVAVVLLFSLCAKAVPVDSVKAQKAFKGWLKMDPSPLNSHLSNQVRSVDSYTDEAGNDQYHVINLQPEGFVVISADDELEPIIAFSSKGSFNSSLSTPLGLLVHKDTSRRNENLKHAAKEKNSQKKSKKQKKWDQFVAKTDSSYTISYGLSTVTDVRVAPLLQSEWGQTHDGYGNLCYNYYTPNNYPSGCVATAMAQLMRFHEYPTSGIGLHTEEIYVDSVAQNATTRGGNGAGGPYSWSNMPMVPLGATATQRSAIGALCYDAGVAVGMDYTADGSGAYIYYPAYATDADRALVNVFDYSNCIGGHASNGISKGALDQMINPNLDAGLPVILGIYDAANPSSSGHAIVADGYGYNTLTLYHHLNMGWYGMDDVWYALPVIDATTAGYYSDVVDDCLYNIYTSGTGEIISGRVTDQAGLPMDGMLVKATQGITVIAQDTTDAKGIYALANLPSGQTCTISVEQNGQTLASIDKTPGTSSDGSVNTGNIWEVDFSNINTAMPPTASPVEVELFDPNQVTIELLAVDDGTPGPLSYIITSLPEHGWLFDPSGTLEISAVPHTLQNNANTVIYQPCPYYFDGLDTFTYKANDGGVAPDGGDSNIADVNVVTNMVSYEIFEENINTNNNYIPFKVDSKKMRCQAIYHASELGSRELTITQLGLKMKVAPPIVVENWTIRLKHTGNDAFPTGVQPFDNDGWTDVYGADVLITTEGDWHMFNLDTSFVYDGVQNLMVDFSFDSTTKAPLGQQGIVYESTRTERRMIANWSDTAMPTSSLSYNWLNRVFNLRLKTEPMVDKLVSDFNYNCSVGYEDMSTMIETWMAQDGDANYNNACDISVIQDKKVDLADFAVLASEWLEALP